VEGSRTAEKRNILLALLEAKQDEDSRSWLVGALANQWSGEVEEVLVRVVRDEKESLQVQEIIAGVLLDKGPVNTHITDALQVIQHHGPGFPRCGAYNYLMNRPLSSLSSQNRQAVLLTGFRILQELPSDELDKGYFVASRLGLILDIPDHFKPDQKLKKYQDKDGNLLESFFADTTRNALDWFEKHGEQLTKASSVRGDPLR
jgi:hypothetical protein